jgi:hypothetical protein
MTRRIDKRGPWSFWDLGDFMKNFKVFSKTTVEDKEAETILDSGAGWLMLATCAFFISLSISLTG